MASELPSELLSLPKKSEDMPTKVYTGSCHCGKFEYKCRHPVLEDGFEVLSCNCGICTQRGYLMIYITNPDDFTLLKGTHADLLDYQFGRQSITHRSCPACGSGIFADATFSGGTVTAVNVRTIADLDLDELTIKKVNGRAV